MNENIAELVFRYWSGNNKDNYDRLISFSKDFLTGNLQTRNMTFLIGHQYSMTTSLMKLLRLVSNDMQYYVLGNPNDILTIENDTKKTTVIIDIHDSISSKRFTPVIKSFLGDDQFVARTLCGDCRIVNNNFHLIIDSNIDFSQTINRPANVLHIENKDYDKIDSIMTKLNGRAFIDKFRNFIFEYDPNKEFGIMI